MSSRKTERKARASNLASNPINRNQRNSTSIKPVNNFATMADIMEHFAPLFEGQTPLPPRSSPPPRQGGYLGARWTPSCGEYKKETLDWLDFIWWDTRQPGYLQLYNVQVCVRDESPAIPFNYTREGVKVQMLDPLTKRPTKAAAKDNPQTYMGGPGEIFVITYPKQRRNFKDGFTTVHVKLPPKEGRPRLIELRADAPGHMHTGYP